MAKFYLFVLLVFAFPVLAQRGYKLQGTVLDSKTGKPMAGVSIQSPETGEGMRTDSSGSFFFSLNGGTSPSFIFSYVGYRSVRERFTLTKNQTVEIKLEPNMLELDEVEVKAGKEDRNVRSVEMSKIQLSIQQIKRIPVVLGESDILKALTLQPGVTTVGEGAGGINVRGGRVDQNLILLEGAPLFNTSHLLGFLSSVNPDIVQDVTLYKGGMPASYGGRLSSLLVMGVRAGGMDRWRYTGGIGPLTSRFVADGPLITKKLSLLVGGRLAYPNFLIKRFPAPTNRNRAFFYDANAKLLFTPNADHRFTLSAYSSFDTFKFPEDTVYFTRTNVVSAAWNGRFGEHLSASVQAYQSSNSFGNEGRLPFSEYKLTSSIAQSEGRAFVLWTPTETEKLEVGGTLTLYKNSPGDLNPVGAESSVRSFRGRREQGREGAAYVNGEWAPISWLTVQAGIRYARYQNMGPGPVYSYLPDVPLSPETISDTLNYGSGQASKSYGGLEPRLALRIGLSKRDALKISYNRTRQFLHLISNTTAISPVDFWKLADGYVPAEVADQFAAGLFHNSTDNDIELSLEGYYKRMSNLVEYRNGATLLLNPAIETDLLPAEGWAYGVETSLNKTKGRLTGQAAYTYSRAFTRVLTPFASRQVNGGNWYPAAIDRPHNLALSLQYQLGHFWTFSSNFVYTTGRPATYPDGIYRFNNQPVIDYTFRNLDRIPPTHRLDISFSKSTKQVASQARYSTWSFGIYNFYGRKNPYSVYFIRRFSAATPYRLAVFGAPIPSLSWNFNF